MPATASTTSIASTVSTATTAATAATVPTATPVAASSSTYLTASPAATPLAHSLQLTYGYSATASAVPTLCADWSKALFEAVQNGKPEKINSIAEGLFKAEPQQRALNTIYRAIVEASNIPDTKLRKEITLALVNCCITEPTAKLQFQ